MTQHRTLKLALLFVGMTLTILMASLVSRLIQMRPLTADGLVGHTQAVYREIQSVLIAALDGETGQRGYLITGNQAYLNTYMGARARLDKHMLVLVGLTRNDSRQQDKLSRLQSILEHKFVELEKTLSVLKAQGRGAAIEVVNSHVGLRDMIEAREIADEMLREEAKLLVIRDREAYNLYYLILVCSLIVLGRDVVFSSLWGYENTHGR